MLLCRISFRLELEVDNILLETMIRQSLRPNEAPTYKLPNYLLTYLFTYSKEHSHS